MNFSEFIKSKALVDCGCGFNEPLNMELRGLPELINDISEYENRFGTMMRMRPRQSGSATLTRLYALYLAMNVEDSLSVLLVNSKEDILIEELKMIQLHGLNFVSTKLESYYISDGVCKMYAIDSDGNVLGTIKIIQTSVDNLSHIRDTEGGKLKLLTPIGAPHTSNYSRFREVAMPLLKQSSGLELILSNGARQMSTKQEVFRDISKLLEVDFKKNAITCFEPDYFITEWARILTDKRTFIGEMMSEFVDDELLETYELPDYLNDILK